MKILFIASEVSPFAKTGGLADVAGSLPKALKGMGHNIRVMMPYYSSVEAAGYGIKKGHKGIRFNMGKVEQKGLLRQSQFAEIPLYLLENKEYFSRAQLYGTPAGDYEDNHIRFAFFCHGAINLLKRLDFRPDIIHCNDWQTALIPILLRHEYSEDPFFRKTAIVYTVHNLAYQGLFPRESLPDMGLDDSYFTIDRLEYYGKVNLMKGGILSSDIVSTVSETYAREILTPEMGCGLDGVLSDREHDLYGILNGLDYDEWNPATDRAIFQTYTATTMKGKAVNKRQLQKALGLEEDPSIPLLAIISRLSAQKGFELVDEILPELESERMQLVILGNGDEKYMRFLSAVKERKPKNISINLDFDATLARRIYAASDIFLMPSRYEPCGLGQLIAFRYGSVPVVRKTGGLADTVIDGRESPREQNGFTFEEFEAEAFMDGIRRALLAYGDAKVWEKIVRRGMNADFSWSSSAARYEELYRNVLERKGW